MIRIVLADDQTLVRAGLRGLLELAGDLQVAAEAADGDEAIAQVRAVAPDLLLLDVRMPRRSGIEVVTELRRLGCLPPTLLLTTFDDDAALLDGMHAGAKGFLLKDVTPERLFDAIRRVARGESLFQPALTARALSRIDSAAPDPSAFTPETLTPRETEILRLMAGGFSNKEIARALGTAEGTVKNHVSSVLSKLGVRDRTRAVLKAMQQGCL